MFHYRTTNKLNKHMYNLKKKKKRKKRKAYLPTLYFFNPLQETNIYFFLALLTILHVALNSYAEDDKFRKSSFEVREITRHPIIELFR